MTFATLIPSHILKLRPYQQGRSISDVVREFGIPEDHIVKLASNENPLGMSPLAAQAIRNGLNRAARYPDADGFDLKAAVAGKYNVDKERIILGNGSRDVMELIARTFATAGSSFVYDEHSFIDYRQFAGIFGVEGRAVPSLSFGHDLDRMLRAIDSTTRIVFVANPNNPTGSFVCHDAIVRFVCNVPQDVLIILDEAYTEYLAPEDRGDSIALTAGHPNLIVVRTFSKAYGLAGVRAGFGITSPEIVDVLNRVRPPFGVNAIAQAAATAALSDSDFVAATCENNRTGLAQVTSGLRCLGFRVLSSHGNFVMCHVGDGSNVYRALLRKGVIVRPLVPYGLNAWLRISIGLPAENDRFLDAMNSLIQSGEIALH